MRTDAQNPMRSELQPDPADTRANNAQTTGTGRIRAVQHPLDALIFHSLAAGLARVLSKTPVTPNMVSLAGGMAIVLAAIIYVQDAWPYSALLGLLIHSGWHVLDGADGDLARLTGKASPQGEVFDGICDYAGHIVLYLTLAGSVADSMGWIAWALAVGAGASRVLQANFYESQRRQYMQWAHGIDWLRTTNASSDDQESSRLGNAYLKLAALLAPGDPALESALADSAQAGPLRQRLAELGAKSLYGSTLLGAPYRTLALGASMLAGSPIWYFLFEIAVLNAVLAASLWRARRTLGELRLLL